MAIFKICGSASMAGVCALYVLLFLSAASCYTLQLVVVIMSFSGCAHMR